MCGLTDCDWHRDLEGTLDPYLEVHPRQPVSCWAGACGASSWPGWPSLRITKKDTLSFILKSASFWRKYHHHHHHYHHHRAAQPSNHPTQPLSLISNSLYQLKTKRKLEVHTPLLPSSSVSFLYQTHVHWFFSSALVCHLLIKLALSTHSLVLATFFIQSISLISHFGNPVSNDHVDCG
jgi:hypothetical protein